MQSYDEKELIRPFTLPSFRTVHPFVSVKYRQFVTNPRLLYQKNRQMLSDRVGRKFEKRLKVIFRACGDGACLAALFARLNDGVLPSLNRDGERLHKALTALSPVARINVYMLAPEAVWAVVGISIPHHVLSAVFAGKIFFGARE